MSEQTQRQAEEWQRLAELGSEDAVYSGDFDAICDAFPQVLAELRAVRAERDRLREAGDALADAAWNVRAYERFEDFAAVDVAWAAWRAAASAPGDAG